MEAGNHVCSRCKEPTGRNSAGYCARCQRDRNSQKKAVSAKDQYKLPRRRVQTVEFDHRTSSDSDQAWVDNFETPNQENWFENRVGELRPPVQRITLDVEQSAVRTARFYRPHELKRYVELLRRHIPEEVGP